MPVYIASSRWFILIASVFYISIALALALIDWPLWCNVVLWLILLFDYHQVIKIYGLRSHKNSVVALQQDCGKWQFLLLSGRQYKGKLLKQRCYCSSLVLIMYLKNLGGGRYIVIPRDSLSAHNYRYLAMYINA